MCKGRGSEFGVETAAIAVHPSGYYNRQTRSCPKINVQLCKRNESPFKADHDIAHSFTYEK